MKFFINMKCEIYSFLILSILTCCTSNDIQIRRKIEELKEKPVVINMDSMDLLKGEVTNYKKDGYKMVSYWSSEECTKCAISHLYLWNYIINKSRNVSFIFIFETKSSQKKDFEYSVENSVENNNVTICIDTLGIFKKDNPVLPQESYFHTFLLDSTNNIILVGNPLNNLKIKNLYFECIKDDKVSKDGESSFESDR